MNQISTKNSVFLSIGIAFLSCGAFSTQANAATLPLTNWSILGNGSSNGTSLFLSTSLGVNTDEAESFLDLSSGTIAGLGSSPTNGSVAKTEIIANAGDQIEFKWLFDTADYLPYNDFSFFSVVGDTSEAFLLADVAQVGNFGAGGGFETYIFSTAGTYTIGFGVFNSIDTAFQSSLEVVPEPLTMFGAATAIGFGASFKRKLAKKQEKEKSNKA